MGIGSESMLSYYHPWATDLYSANKNIRTLCATLCDSEFVRRKKEQLRREIDVVENHNRCVWYHLAMVVCFCISSLLLLLVVVLLGIITFGIGYIYLIGTVCVHSRMYTHCAHKNYIYSIRHEIIFCINT